MKRSMCIAAALMLFLFAGVSCKNDSGASSGKVKIGFVVKQPEEPWFQLEWKFADEAAAKHGFELIKLPAQDGQKVISAIDSLATQGANGLVICAPDVRLGPAIVARAQKNNLKIIAVDDQFIDADGKFMTDVHYLGISARKIGNMVGKELRDQAKARNWNIDETGVCVITFEQLDTARERTDGAVESLQSAGFPAAKIFKVPQKTTDQPGARDAANVLLTQQPGIKRWLICGMNDSAVIGAVRAMEGRGVPTENIIGIGINGTDCIAEFERPQASGFYASVLLSAREHGYKTAEMLYKWIKDGQEPPKDTRTTGVLITRQNYQQVRKEQGITN